MTRSKADSDSERHRPSWTVRPDEDLGRLAKHLFTNARYGWIIADLNQGSTSELIDGAKRVVKLRVGQKIYLPVWQDIVAFHERRTDVEIGNLITVTVPEPVSAELTSWELEAWHKL